MRLFVSNSNSSRVFQIKDDLINKYPSWLQDIKEHAEPNDDNSLSISRNPHVYDAIVTFFRCGDFTFSSYSGLREIRLEAEFLVLEPLIQFTKTKLGGLTINANGSIITVTRVRTYPLLKEAFDVDECKLDDKGRPYTEIHPKVFHLLDVLLDPLSTQNYKKDECVKNEYYFVQLQELVHDTTYTYGPWISLGLYDFIFYLDVYVRPLGLKWREIDESISTVTDDKLVEHTEFRGGKKTGFVFTLQKIHEMQGYPNPLKVTDVVKSGERYFEPVGKPDNVLIMSMSILSRFLLQPNLFRYDIWNYMPLKVFHLLYDAFREKNGYSKIKWTRDHYQTEFEAYGLSLQTAALNYRDSQVRWAVYVRGIDILTG